MKVKESEALGSKRQTSSFKYRPTSRLSHPGSKSSLTFRNPTALTLMLYAPLCGLPPYFRLPFRVFGYVHDSIKHQ